MSVVSWMIGMVVCRVELCQDEEIGDNVTEER